MTEPAGDPDGLKLKPGDVLVSLKSRKEYVLLSSRQDNDEVDVVGLRHGTHYGPIRIISAKNVMKNFRKTAKTSSIKAEHVMSGFARLGGLSKSEKRAATSRQNGKHGGRPKRSQKEDNPATPTDDLIEERRPDESRPD